MSPLLHNPDFFHVAPAPLPKVAARPRPDLVQPLRDVERAHVERALILCEGNRGLAAKRLGVALRTLMRWIEKFRDEDMSEESYLA